MDKLTIEQKAKAYDEAIENGKQILNTSYTAHWDTMKEVVEHLLPELKESEDDKIRKELLEHCKNQAKPYIQTGNECPQIQSWITWLEKQGEKDNLSIDFVLGYLGIKPAYKDGNTWCILLGDNIQEGICGFGDTKEDALIAFIKELIEKQGKKKSTIVDIMKNYFATTPKEQQNKDWEELKHLNDIGPDIKIAFGAKDSELVEINPTEFDTRLQALIGKFGSLPKEELIGSLSFWMNVVQNDGTYKPVEKQGEQMPTDKIEPKFKVGDIIRHKEQGFTCKIIAIDTEYRLSECCGTHLPFDSQDAYELVEQKPAWSEEDETTMNNISHIIRQYDKISKRENQPCYYVGDCLLWMQNIKDRVQPQSTWKPSDEQMKVLDAAVMHSHLTTTEYDGLVKLREQLKKLK